MKIPCRGRHRSRRSHGDGYASKQTRQTPWLTTNFVMVVTPWFLLNRQLDW
jgi:hypothetical protein